MKLYLAFFLSTLLICQTVRCQDEEANPEVEIEAIKGNEDSGTKEAKKVPKGNKLPTSFNGRPYLPGPHCMPTFRNFLRLCPEDCYRCGFYGPELRSCLSLASTNILCSSIRRRAPYIPNNALYRRPLTPRRGFLRYPDSTSLIGQEADMTDWETEDPEVPSDIEIPSLMSVFLNPRLLQVASEAFDQSSHIAEGADSPPSTPEASKLEDRLLYLIPTITNLGYQFLTRAFGEIIKAIQIAERQAIPILFKTIQFMAENPEDSETVDTITIAIEPPAAPAFNVKGNGVESPALNSNEIGDQPTQVDADLKILSQKPDLDDLPNNKTNILVAKMEKNNSHVTNIEEEREMQGSSETYESQSLENAENYITKPSHTTEVPQGNEKLNDRAALGYSTSDLAENSRRIQKLSYPPPYARNNSTPYNKEEKDFQIFTYEKMLSDASPDGCAPCEARRAAIATKLAELKNSGYAFNTPSGIPRRINSQPALKPNPTPSSTTITILGQPFIKGQQSDQEYVDGSGNPNQQSLEHFIEGSEDSGSFDDMNYHFSSVVFIDENGDEIKDFDETLKGEIADFVFVHDAGEGKALEKTNSTVSLQTPENSADDEKFFSGKALVSDNGEVLSSESVLLSLDNANPEAARSNFIVSFVDGNADQIQNSIAAFKAGEPDDGSIGESNLLPIGRENFKILSETTSAKNENADIQAVLEKHSNDVPLISDDVALYMAQSEKLFPSEATSETSLAAETQVLQLQGSDVDKETLIDEQSDGSNLSQLQLKNTDIAGSMVPGATTDSQTATMASDTDSVWMDSHESEDSLPVAHLTTIGASVAIESDTLLTPNPLQNVAGLQAVVPSLPDAAQESTVKAKEGSSLPSSVFALPASPEHRDLYQADLDIVSESSIEINMEQRSEPSTERAGDPTSSEERLMSSHGSAIVDYRELLTSEQTDTTIENTTDANPSITSDSANTVPSPTSIIAPRLTKSEVRREYTTKGERLNRKSKKAVQYNGNWDEYGNSLLAIEKGRSNRKRVGENKVSHVQTESKRQRKVPRSTTSNNSSVTTRDRVFLPIDRNGYSTSGEPGPLRIKNDATQTRKNDLFSKSVAYA